MSLLFFEGFEGLGPTSSSTTDVQTRLHRRFPGTPLDGGNGVRLIDNDLANGGKALSWGTASTAESNFLYVPVVDQAGKTITVGFRIRVSTSVVADQNIFHAKQTDASTNQLRLHIQNNQDILVQRNTTTIANALSVLSPGDWHYIEFEFLIANVGGTVKVWVDDVEVINSSSLDTQNDSTNTITEFLISGLESVSAADPGATDDIYILNSDGSYLNSRLGPDTRVKFFSPTADGTVQWTPSTGSSHFALVDEDPESGTDYVSENTVGDLERFTHIIDEMAILAVKVEGEFSNPDTGTPSKVRANCLSGATTSTGDTKLVGSSTMHIEHIYPVDPNTGLAWTEANLEAAQIGWEVVS